MPFSSVFVIDFKQVNACWVPPYQFINAEITYCQKFSEIAAHKKRLSSKVVVPKKTTFFSCRLPRLFAGNSFF